MPCITLAAFEKRLVMSEGESIAHAADGGELDHRGAGSGVALVVAAVASATAQMTFSRGNSSAVSPTVDLPTVHTALKTRGDLRSRNVRGREIRAQH